MSTGEPPPERGQTAAVLDRVAVELFSQRGYHATSMREIAAAAGIRPAAIYHWFASKEAILVHLQDTFMDELTAAVVAAVERHERPALRLAAAVREHVVFHGNHRQAAFVTDSEIRALTPGPRERLIAQRDAYQARFHAMIRDGVRDGALRSSNARVATYAILLQCTGVALWFDPDGPLGLEEVAELHVELVLGSLQASPELIEEAIAACRGTVAGQSDRGEERA
jgi:AcrR family transcriptional regulator